MKYWSGEATIFGAKALYGPRFRNAFCCEMSTLLSRQGLLNISRICARSDVGHTSKPVDSPLLELFKCDLSGWRDLVEVQSMRIFKLFVRGSCEQLFFII